MLLIYIYIYILVRIYVCMYVSRHHSQTLESKRPEFGMCSKNPSEHYLTPLGVVMVWFFISCSYYKLFRLGKVNQTPIRQKVGMWSPSTRDSIVNHIWVWIGHSHTHSKVVLSIRTNGTINQTENLNEVSKQLDEHY